MQGTLIDSFAGLSSLTRKLWGIAEGGGGVYPLKQSADYILSYLKVTILLGL